MKINKQKLILALAVLLASSPAIAQQAVTITQSGNVTAGDCTQWVSKGIVKDSGAACGGGGSPIFTSIVKIDTNAIALPSNLTGSLLQAGNLDGTATRIEADAFGAASFFSGVRKDGTNASPTALVSGDEIASLNAWGYNGTAVVGPQAAYREYASQNWSVGANGTYLSLATTVTGGTTLTEAMRVENDGGITLPSTVTGGDKGVGTINTQGIYVNGGAIPLAQGGTASISALAARSSNGLNIDACTTKGDVAYSISASDKCVVTTTALSAQRTWTLPAANTLNAGQHLLVIDNVGAVSNVFNLIVAPNGSDTIMNNTASMQINNPMSGIDFVTDGVSAWNAAPHKQCGLNVDAICEEYVYNYSPSNMVHWRKGKGNVISGNVSSRTLIIGDSESAGFGAGTPIGGLNGTDFQQSWPARMVDTFNNAGLNATEEAFYGNEGGAGQRTFQYSAQLSISGTWQQNGPATIGGDFFYNSTTGGTLSYKTLRQVDTYIISYSKCAICGTLGWQVDNGSVTTINTNNSTPIVASTTITTTRGYHTLNITQTAGTNLYFQHMEGIDSTAPAAIVYNAGWTGSTTGNWNQSSGSGWDAPTQIPTLALDLCIIKLGTNDLLTSVSVSTYKTNMQVLITACKSAGADVVLESFVPSNPAHSAQSTNANQLLYVSALYQLSQSNNIPLFDLFNKIQSYTAGNALGEYYDDLHLNMIGNGYEGHWIGNLLMRI